MLISKIALLTIGSAFAVATCTPKNAPLSSGADLAEHKMEYEKKIAPILEHSCKPCHFPDAGGKRRALHEYERVVKNVEHILKRTQKEPGSKGFMPYKSKRDPLTAQDIQTIKDWAAKIPS